MSDPAMSKMLSVSAKVLVTEGKHLGKRVTISMKEEKGKVVVSASKVEYGGLVATEYHVQSGDDRVCQDFSFFKGKPCWDFSDNPVSVSKKEEEALEWAGKLVRHLEKRGAADERDAAHMLGLLLVVYSLLSPFRLPIDLPLGVK